MPSIIAPITAQAVVYACPTDAFVSANGWDRIAVSSSALAAAQAMGNAKKIDASAKRGKYTLKLAFIAYHKWNNLLLSKCLFCNYGVIEKFTHLYHIMKYLLVNRKRKKS